ncbi:MAG: hypothetical protein HPY83_16740 [Anaerolineae bacterium]|nr:hypothetical protein [Anaerolineae bacterium]
MRDSTTHRTGFGNGTWYLAQAADGAWRMHARSEAELAPLRVLAELSGYPAVVTSNGNLFHLGMPAARLVNLRSN